MLGIYRIAVDVATLDQCFMLLGLSGYDTHASIFLH
jgi:hypothetical protein